MVKPWYRVSAVLLGLGLSACDLESTSPALAWTDSGRVLGRAESGVKAWLGIPYVKAPEFLTLYPAATVAEVKVAAQDAANDAAGLFNARECAQLRAQHQKSATYITVFARRHPYVPGVRIADQDTATVGAYHTSEVPYYFGTQDAYNAIRPTRNWTPWDRELSAKLTASLIAFARTGNPSTADVAWPAWSGADERYIRFGDDIRLVALNRLRLDFMGAHRPARMPPGPGRRVRD